MTQRELYANDVVDGQQKKKMIYVNGVKKQLIYFIQNRWVDNFNVSQLYEYN